MIINGAGTVGGLWPDSTVIAEALAQRSGSRAGAGSELLTCVVALRDLYRRLAGSGFGYPDVSGPGAIATPPGWVPDLWAEEHRARARLSRAVHELAGVTGAGSDQLTAIAAELAEIARHHAAAFSPYGFVLDGPEAPARRELGRACSRHDALRLTVPRYSF